MAESSSQERRESALIALRQILRATELNSRALAKNSGLNPSQLILLHLLAREGAVTSGKAAEHMSLSQATVTALADKLLARNLISRVRDAADKRRVMLSLTEAGTDLLDNVPDMLQARFSHRFETIKDWEQAWLVAALERVAAMLDAEDMDAAPVLDVGAISEISTHSGSKP